ncbi:helix-turn-helix domain-containing protein [Piscinibacter sp. XHJ-5]|uniref:TetR/AcrR family transcriptional regulator n=1 Tax=Piscinibacter sp. XHJ-5 TaxID=3037797 RepID=UPI002453194C|nr:helix-turn-helix domain-containing protein [Piscinibacter sp. XHJ-5]
MAASSAAPPRTAAKKSRAGTDPRHLRSQALADVRRELVLDAARSAFFELGMEKTSMREIAHRAGYTPGAIYSYFAGKEQVYGALLGESLQRLDERVQAAASKCRVESDRARAAASAFFDFYRENPRDLDLGFYLFQGMRPRGLTPELNDALNRRLRQCLQPTQAALEALGMSAATALREVTALFAHTVGLLVLSHTGRIRMFKQASQDLFDTYLEQLIRRAEAMPRRA